MECAAMPDLDRQYFNEMRPLLFVGDPAICFQFPERRCALTRSKVGLGNAKNASDRRLSNDFL
jgi:hypothetical protein